MAENLLTLDEVAEYVHLSSKTVWREIQRGNLAARKVCNRWLIREADVEAWLERGSNSARSVVGVDTVVPVPPAAGSLAALRRIESEAA